MKTKIFSILLLALLSVSIAFDVVLYTQLRTQQKTIDGITGVLVQSGIVDKAEDGSGIINKVVRFKDLPSVAQLEESAQ